MAETVKVEVDLDLNPKLAKEKLDDFKKSVKDEKIPVKLDLDNVKGDALKLKNVLSDAFKLDNSTLGNLKQIEDSLKQINKLIKSQADLNKKNSTKGMNLGLDPITIKKNVDIVKDVNVLVDDYKEATSQLDALDKIGRSMKEALDDFNKDQEEAFRKFSEDSKSYEKYLNELQGDNATKALKDAIKNKKKAIELQEELTRLGVVKVDNTQLRNEKADGTIFTIDNEKWMAMFARSESEAKDLEDMARKLKSKIDSANNSVHELLKDLSSNERELLNSFSRAYEKRPQFDRLTSGMDNENVSVLRMYLESMMPDVDKLGLDF